MCMDANGAQDACNQQLGHKNISYKRNFYVLHAATLRVSSISSAKRGAVQSSCGTAEYASRQTSSTAA
jgi:hypothetical protein